jgi:glutamate N-acetyltransferase/amino-acid N-acetyltransferase
MLLPRGFSLSGVACGLKVDPDKLDLGLVLSHHPAAAAGVYTTNRVLAAPVELDRARTPSDSIRAVVVNSGNANACTGERGRRDAVQMTECVARECPVFASDVLVMSTGIIGRPLDMAKVERGISSAARQLRADPQAMERFAWSLMTTDTVPKLASRSVKLGNPSIVISGFAKGAGMIAPGMATMLGLILTDAALSPDQAQRMIKEAADRSFNAISIDGHMSTNDTLLLLANGAAFEAAVRPSVGPVSASTCALGRDAERELQRYLNEICQELAKAIVRDGEGATHLIEIRVTGCRSNDDARSIAREIANSPLVKTAIAGADPNWGRIVSAAGYAGVEFDARASTLTLNGVPIFQGGEPLSFDAGVLSDDLRRNVDVRIDLACGTGPGTDSFWTCDLTAEYVRINADYHT